jgi:hypothetical protein
MKRVNLISIKRESDEQRERVVLAVAIVIGFIMFACFTTLFAASAS